MSMQGPDDYNMMDHHRRALRRGDIVLSVVVLIAVGGFAFTVYVVALALGVVS